MNANATITPSISLVDVNFSQMGGGAAIYNNGSTGNNTPMSFTSNGTLTKGTASTLTIRGHTGGNMSVSLNNIEMTDGQLLLGADYATNVNYGLTALDVSGTANLSSSSASSAFAISTAPGVTASLQQVNLAGNMVVRLSATQGVNRVRNVTMTGLNGTSGTTVQGNSVANTGNSYTTLTINSTPSTTSTFNGTVANGTGTQGHYMNLVKGGTGTQVLGGSNTYTGTTTVNGGTLAATTSSGLGSGGNGIYSAGNISNAVTVNGTSAAATLDLQGGLTVNKPVTLAGSTNGASLINSVASTTATLTGGGVLSAVSFATAPTNLATGTTASITGGGGSGATATASLGLTSATLNLNVSGSSGYVVGNLLNISGGGGSGAQIIVTAVTSGKITAWNVLSPGVGFTSLPTSIANNSGTTGTGVVWNAATNNTFTLIGLTLTNAGSGYTSAPTVALSSGTALGGSGVLPSVTLDGTSNNIGGAGNVAINSVIGGSGGGFSKIGNGTATLSAANTYTGDTTVTTGTLLINTAATAGNSGTGAGSGFIRKKCAYRGETG